MKQPEINLNTLALSSKYVITKVSPIVYATVHDDGIWEFWSKETIEEEEIMVVTLKQIIEIDPSINEIIHIAEGIAAVRNDISTPWQFVSKN